MGVAQSSTIFYIVRHGETDWNKKSIIQGQSESHLTPLGKNQARKLAKELENVKFDLVISSDLSRCKETAVILASESRLNILTDTALRERKFGRYEGKKKEIFYKDLQTKLNKIGNLSYEDRKSYKLFPDVETDEEITTRFIKFLKKTARAYYRKNILVVTHGGLIKHFLVHIGFAGEEDLQPGAIKNSGYVKISSDGVSFKIEEIRNIEKRTVF